MRAQLPLSKRGRGVLGVVASLALGLAAVYLVAWSQGPVEPVPFFGQESGEGQILVFAHQGGEELAPSNTMAAFTNAIDIGADVLDTDMHMTADGVLVLIHDETVDRTSDGTGAVRDLTLEELRVFDFGYNFTIDSETYPYRNQGVGIVTVEELFTAFPDKRFGIEIKQTTADAATRLCELISRFAYHDKVLVSSFAQPNMDVFRRACPEVATSATEGEVRIFYLLHRIGLSGLAGGLGDPAYDAFQVPEFSGDRLILSEGFVADARGRGLPIVPWTINDPEDLERMIDLGVDGINTDYPDRLLDQ